MANSRASARGFSLIEMLVVLVIVGVLVMVAVSRIGNSRSNAVVSVTDQVEATLYAAQRVTTTSLGMVEITLSGSWEDRNLILSYTGAAPADVFQYTSLTANQPDFRKAGIDPTGGDKWPSMYGTKPSFVGAEGTEVLAAMEQPLQGLAGKKVSITATRKEFSDPCFIAIVPMDDQRKPLYGGPMGLVVMQGHLIYKYLRSGGDQPWRRA